MTSGGSLYGQGVDQLGELRLDLVDRRELGKGLAAEAAEIIHARHPIGTHGIGLFLGVLAAIGSRAGANR